MPKIKMIRTQYYTLFLLVSLEIITIATIGMKMCSILVLHASIRLLPIVVIQTRKALEMDDDTCTLRGTLTCTRIKFVTYRYLTVPRFKISDRYLAGRSYGHTFSA